VVIACLSYQLNEYDSNGVGVGEKMNLQFNYLVIQQDRKKLPKLLAGLILVSLGLMFSKRSGLGMLPWGVLHSGISNVTGLTFGQAVQILGIIILILSMIFVKILPGVGTVLNVILVGLMYDVFDQINSQIHLLNDFSISDKSATFVDSLNQSVNVFTNNPALTEQILYLFVGILVTGLGSALYISCSLGAGPRDGLFVGVTQITGLSVQYTKPAIEVVATVIGIFLSGSFGFGTIVNALVSGYVVHFFFKLLKFNAKKKKHNHLLSYVSKK